MLWGTISATGEIWSLTAAIWRMGLAKRSLAYEHIVAHGWVKDGSKVYTTLGRPWDV